MLQNARREERGETLQIQETLFPMPESQMKSLQKERWMQSISTHQEQPA